MRLISLSGIRQIDRGASTCSSQICLFVSYESHTIKHCIRRTKLIELRQSWKAQLSSCGWVWIAKHVLFNCFRWMYRRKIVGGTNVDLHMRRTKLKKMKNLYDNVYLASFGKTFFTDLIQLIGSMHPKFDDPPKLEFGSDHEEFDVWPRPLLIKIFRRKNLLTYTSIDVKFNHLHLPVSGQFFTFLTIRLSCHA